MKILNTWTSKKNSKQYYNESNLVFEHGEYRIFKQFEKSYLYIFKDVAITNLCGLNKAHLISVANRERPTGNYSSDHFLYDRTIESLEKGLKLAS